MGLKGWLPAMGCGFIGFPGPRNPAPGVGGGQDPHPFRPGLGQIGQDRPRGSLLGVGAGCGSQTPLYFGGTFPY